MPGMFEKSYGKLFKFTKLAINPFKKAIIVTECTIHKFINYQAIIILKNDNYLDAYSLFSDYNIQLDEGVVWADQDLKSSGHFYSPIKDRGLFGNSNALSLALEYYQKSIEFWRIGDNEKAAFFLGATAHLIQDMTVPQHANIKLLHDHRNYENFIKSIYLNTPQFFVFKGGYYLNSIEDFIRCNARTSMRIYDKLNHIEEDEKKFFLIAKFTLPLAQKTTAGCFLKFYKDISNLKSSNPNSKIK